MRNTLGALVLAMGVLAVCVSAQTEPAQAAAVAKVRALADRGDAKAQVQMGRLYAEGDLGVPQDGAQAVAWCRKAAEQGDAGGQICLGDLYSFCEGVPQDYVQAAAWYLKAAEQGDARGQGRVGGAYYDGKGVPQDYVQAVAWYLKAAEQGDDVAQIMLGTTVYWFGKGVPEDKVEAYKWLIVAASHAPSPSLRSVATQGVDYFAKQMTSAQVAEAQKRAREWDEAFERRQKK